MPESITNRFVALDFAEASNDQVRLRFVPIDFDLNHPEPILELVVVGPDATANSDKRFDLIREGIVNGIEETDADRVSIWIETLDTPVVFQGHVEWKRSEYERKDLVAAILENKSFRKHQNDEIQRLKQTIHEAKHFIDRTAARIEQKLEMSSTRDKSLAKQIELLTRVRRQLENDKR